MGNFKKEKGRVVADMRMGVGTRVVIHMGTDPSMVKMLGDAIERVKKSVKKES